MIENIQDINDKLTMFLPISSKARIRFICIFLILMLDKIKGNIDKIKDINKSIINLIILDFKTLKNKIRNILFCNDNGNERNNKSKMVLFDNVFNAVVEFLNLILVGKDKFIISVAKNKIPWHLVNNALNINEFINNNERNKV